MNRIGFFIGLGFGFVLTAAGLGDYDVIHGALLLRNVEMYLLMGSAVAIAMPLLWILQRRRWRTLDGEPIALVQEAVQRKHILGGMVFGVGMAVTGTCPGTVVSMTAGGSVLGAVVGAGLVTGLLLRDTVAAGAPRPHATLGMPQSAELTSQR